MKEIFKSLQKLQHHNIKCLLFVLQVFAAQKFKKLKPARN